jgi:hypothetical protein
MAPEIDELAEGIFATREYAAPQSPAKKDFMPWHKPRKHFVRDGQWREQIELLLPEIESEVCRGGRPLTYLGLPGTDLLDLRFFHERVCIPKELGFLFLGFNTAAQPRSSEQTEMNVSLDEMRKQPLVAVKSKVLSDDFRKIGNKKSVAYIHTFDTGPFDIVNLDLCDGFAADPPGVDDNLYVAMNTLMTLQARRKTPWLFLLTTLVGEKHIHDDALEVLLKKYLQNLSDGADFRAASAKHLSIGDAEEVHRTITTDKGLADVFLTGLCKWLFGLALIQRPPVSAELKSVIGYSMYSQVSMDLVSLAVKFSPLHVPAEDPTGLAGPPVEPPSETRLASKIPGRVARRINADVFLAERPELLQEMQNAQAGLLEQARYNVDDYHTWVQQKYGTEMTQA